MPSPQPETFDEKTDNMFSPEDYALITDQVISLENTYREFLKFMLDAELAQNPPPTPLTDEDREKRLDELLLLYPMSSSNDTTDGFQWWPYMPSDQELNTDPWCDPTDENSLCSLGICYKCLSNSSTNDSKIDEFEDILASLGIVTSSPIPQENLVHEPNES